MNLRSQRRWTQMYKYSIETCSIFDCCGCMSAVILQDDMKYSNKPYDEAFEFSQDLSVAESFDGRDKKASSVPRERKQF